MHGATTDELVTGLTGIDEVIGVAVVFRKDYDKYIHNYIGEIPTNRQVVEIETKDGVSGELSHVLRTEKGMQYIKGTCAHCPPGITKSYWTLPKEKFLFSESSEGLE